MKLIYTIRSAWAEPSMPIAKARQLQGDDDLLAAALDAISATAWHELTNPLLQGVLQKATSEPDAFMADLAEIYPDMDQAELQQQLARCIFVSDIVGQLTDASG